MKIQKFNENIRSVPVAKDIVNKYHSLLNEVKNGVIEKNNQIAENDDLSQHIVDVYGGDFHTILHNKNNIKIVEIKIHDNQFFCTLENSDFWSEETYTYYVPFTDEEFERLLLGVDASKYNL